MKKKKQELISKLDKIVSAYQELDEACDLACEVGCLEVEGKLWAAIWGGFEDMVDLLEPTTGDWISWYIWDNKCGESGRSAKSGKMKELKPIRNTKELAELILKDEC